jgi:hypothetical protein
MKKTSKHWISHRKAERKLERELGRLMVIAKILVFLTAWITHC